MSVVADGTTNGPYATFQAGSIFVEVGVRTSQKMYFASKTANAVIEILMWK